MIAEPVIVIDPEVMNGTPCFRGTRVPFKNLMDYLAGGHSLADLRINAGQFEKMLQDESGTTTGRLDTRFSGPTFDPLSKEAEYDPQSAAISSAYVSAFNDYVRKELNYGDGQEFKPEIDLWRSWNFLHQGPGAPLALPIAANVMPDLAIALKYNPDLKVLLNAGDFD